MVFESIVTDLMNRFLGDFIENLDHKQLNIGIWGGKCCFLSFTYGIPFFYACMLSLFWSNCRYRTTFFFFMYESQFTSCCQNVVNIFAPVYRFSGKW